MAKRIGRGNRVVDQLWRAQEARCFHCGLPLSRNTSGSVKAQRWTREHLIPRSVAGPGRPDIIVLAHRSCNGARSDALPTAYEIARAENLYGLMGRVFDPYRWHSDSELPRHVVSAGEGACSGVSSLTLAGPSSEMAPAVSFGEAG